MLLALKGCIQKNDEYFFKKVLSDFSRNSYFVLINRTLAEETTGYIIKNDDLYSFIHKSSGVMQDEYVKKMSATLSKNESLQIVSKEIKAYSFFKVLPNEEISNDAEKGKSYFLEKYFNERVLKGGITDNDKYLIISILYQWRVACKIDDESGYLIIDK